MPIAKIYKSYILTPPHPQGHVMPVKCEEPIDELAVQVWLLYHHPNFKYCTLFVSGTELRTERRSDYKMPPADLSGRGHKIHYIESKFYQHESHNETCPVSKCVNVQYLSVKHYILAESCCRYY